MKYHFETGFRVETSSQGERVSSSGFCEIPRLRLVQACPHPRLVKAGGHQKEHSALCFNFLF